MPSKDNVCHKFFYISDNSLRPHKESEVEDGSEKKKLIFLPCGKIERPSRKILRALKAKMHYRTLRTEDAKVSHQNVKKKKKTKKQKSKKQKQRNLRGQVSTHFKTLNNDMAH